MSFVDKSASIKGALGLCITLLPCLSTSSQAASILIEPVDVLPAELFNIKGTAASESDRRTNKDVKYDNLRASQVGMGYGLGDGLEVGAYVGYDQNNFKKAPDQDGLEGVSVYGKMVMSPNFSIKAGLTTGGEHDLYPYPNDGVDLFVDVPFQRMVRNGDKIYGEIGYTLKDQDHLATDNYFNFGLGYEHPLKQSLSVNLELVGDEGPVTGNQLQLLLGLSSHPTTTLWISPYVSMGVYDASPQYAVGAKVEWRF
jgi:hypothetical protein